MTLETKSYDELVTDQATAIQSSATTKLGKILNFAIGTVLRAIVEATAGVFLWLQGLIVKVLATTRLGSSTGEDVDSFIADYGLERLAAVKATGNVTFSRNITANEAVIELGRIVQSPITIVKFAVVADTTNASYDPSQEAYIIPVGTASTEAKVEAVVAGITGNASEDTITVIPKPIDNVDFVTNGNAFTNGAAIESDAAVKLRFIDYINSLSKATKLAIEEAVESVQQGINFLVVENTDYTTDLLFYGTFYIIIDDGTGSPPQSLLDSVYNAADRVRALTSFFDVHAATSILAAVSATIHIDEDIYDPSDMQAAVETSLADYISSLTIGETLYYTKLVQVIYNTSVGIVDVGDLLLNGGSADVTVTNKETVLPGTLTISVQDTNP